MFGIIIVLVASAFLYLIIDQSLKFWRHTIDSKRTGLPHLHSPFVAVTPLSSILGDICIPILLKLPISRHWQWLDITEGLSSWNSPRKFHDTFGDTYTISAPHMCYIKTTNAELIDQITAREHDFVKPLGNYKVIDLFGTNIVSTEGDEWRKHRKIVGPSFSEKSNGLVFEESLRQAEGMLAFWAKKEGNTPDDFHVDTLDADTAMLSLHVICAAGFGVPQTWPGEQNSETRDRVVPGFESSKATGAHLLTLKEALGRVLHGIVFFAFLTPWQLKVAPFKAMKALHQAHEECLGYFQELVKRKRQQLATGEKEEGIMDLIGAMVTAHDGQPSDSKPTHTGPSTFFTKEDIMANSFILLLAGHETTANSIHYCVLFLALDLSVQRQVQAQIDAILSPTKTDSDSAPLSQTLNYTTHMPLLYRSLLGAVMNEQLRLIPAIPNIPKVAVGDQIVSIDGAEHLIPDKTFFQINVIGANRNPRYWPHRRSKIPGHGSENDLDEFVPARWLSSYGEAEGVSKQVPEKCETSKKTAAEVDGLEETVLDTRNTTHTNTLFKPPKGANPTFSEGPRACPGKRFAQIEVMAVLTAIFARYSVELDVRAWASDEELRSMGKSEREAVYQKARDWVRKEMRNCDQIITLKIKKSIGIRFFRRGKESFEV